MAGALFLSSFSRFAAIAINRAYLPLICAGMKLYHNNAKGRYGPLQRKTSHKTPARVNCQALVFVRVRCHQDARAGYADRDDARQDRRRPRRHPRRDRRAWADRAGAGPLRRGRFLRARTGAGGRPVKIGPSAPVLRFFAPFCDDGNGLLRPSFDRRSLSKRINCPCSALNMVVSALCGHFDRRSALIGAGLRVTPRPKRSRAALIGAVLPA